MLSFNTANAELGLGVTVKGGSLGIGADITKSITEKINVRAGMTQYTYGMDGEMAEDSVSYAGDFNLSNWSVLADYHPWGGVFRLSLGMMGNGNEIEATIKPTNEKTIGDRTYTIDEQGSLTTLIDWGSMAPYFGLGWGNAAEAGKGLGFNIDMGAMYQNSPNVKMTGVGMIAPSVRNAENIQKDLEGAKVWAVFSIGLSYSF